MTAVENTQSGGTLIGMEESPNRTSDARVSALTPAQSSDVAAVNGKASKVSDAEFEALLAKVLVDDAELLERLSR